MLDFAGSSVTNCLCDESDDAPKHLLSPIEVDPVGACGGQGNKIDSGSRSNVGFERVVGIE